MRGRGVAALHGYEGLGSGSNRLKPAIVERDFHPAAALSYRRDNMADYVRNAWYPAAWSRDIARTLISRRVLEQEVVLYRTSTGSVAALEDVCPHRFTPLSMGRLRDDAIECGYHGMTFDCSGACVRIP